MNDYLEMKNRHSKEFGKFPMVFAFSDKQFEEGMKKLGLKLTDTDKVYKSFGGGFYKKTDAKLLRDMIDRHSTEMGEAIKADVEGCDFVLAMFDYELGNHEYCYTGDITDTLETLGLSLKEVQESKSLSNGLEKAIANQIGE